MNFKPLSGILSACFLVLTDKSYFHLHRVMNMRDKHVTKDRLKHDEYEKSFSLHMLCIHIRHVNV